MQFESPGGAASPSICGVSPKAPARCRMAQCNSAQPRALTLAFFVCFRQRCEKECVCIVIEIPPRA
jgi:hypothetical protein